MSSQDSETSKPRGLPRRLQPSHKALGIAKDYIVSCKLPLCDEPLLLVDTELDFYQRQPKLTPQAFKAWTRMRSAATDAGISLFLISAFRSTQYQYNLIRRKLDQGQTIEQILKVNAAPGFSEHHTGMAVDVGTMGCDALVERFENTDAFQWLVTNSSSYKFTLSYPRNNRSGIAYEPWHWCFRE